MRSLIRKLADPLHRRANLLALQNDRLRMVLRQYSFKIRKIPGQLTADEKPLAKLEEQVIDVPGLKVIATDISEDAINISKVNAGIAGVEELIEFAVCDFEETTIPETEKGVIYFNPEYGDRLGVAAGMIFGMKKTVLNSVDFGTIVLSGYAPAQA